MLEFGHTTHSQNKRLLRTSDSLPKAQKNDESHCECGQGQGIANSVQHPEAQHQLFVPQLQRQSHTFWESALHNLQITLTVNLLSVSTNIFLKCF